MERLLMHMGPCVTNAEVLRAGVVEQTGFATPEFIEAMRKALRGLRHVTGAGEEYMPFLIPGSGTSAMESMTSLLSKGDRVLVLSNGVFGDRWRAIFERYPVHVDYRVAEAGKCVETDGVSGHYSMVCMTHVETSTGVRMDVKGVAEEMREFADTIVVDGVASAGGEEVRCGEWGIDAFVTASQKAIGSTPGLGLAVVRKGMIKKESIANFYLNLANWEKVSEAMLQGKGAYFATPPISSVFSLSKAFELIDKEGLGNRIARHRRVAEIIWNGLEVLGLQTVASGGLRSSTVTGVIAETDIDSFLMKCMKRGVEFASGVHPSLKGRYFRIGHMGWVTDADAKRAIDTIRDAMGIK